MAEDEVDEVINDQDEFLAGQTAGRPFKPSKPRCNFRLEELARPRKWLLLGTWREFHSIFDPERMQRFKQRVQEEFSMTPEETALYFSQLKKHVRKMRSKKAMEKQLKREKAVAKQEAYAILRKRLRKALRYAFEHQPPAIVSPLLRELSENILEKLADIHRVDVPNRDSADRNSMFLVCIADWTAKLISNIYYEVDAIERSDVERIKEYPTSRVSICPSSLSEEEAEEEEDLEGLYGEEGEGEEDYGEEEEGEEGEGEDGGKKAGEQPAAADDAGLENYE